MSLITVSDFPMLVPSIPLFITLFVGKKVNKLAVKMKMALLMEQDLRRR
jgi:hypothetical protein